MFERFKRGLVTELNSGLLIPGSDLPYEITLQDSIRRLNYLIENGQVPSHLFFDTVTRAYGLRSTYDTLTSGQWPVEEDFIVTNPETGEQRFVHRYAMHLTGDTYFQETDVWYAVNKKTLYAETPYDERILATWELPVTARRGNKKYGMFVRSNVAVYSKTGDAVWDQGVYIISGSDRRNEGVVIPETVQLSGMHLQIRDTPEYSKGEALKRYRRVYDTKGKPKSPNDWRD